MGEPTYRDPAMRRYLPLLLLGLWSCGGSGKDDTSNPNEPPPPPDPGPADVVIVDAQAGTGFGQIVVHLRNDGGVGTYKLHFYGLPTSPNGPNRDYGQTEPIAVDTSYEESLRYQVRNFPDDPPVSYILAFTRDEGSAIYSETDSLQYFHQ